MQVLSCKLILFYEYKKGATAPFFVPHHRVILTSRCHRYTLAIVNNESVSYDPTLDH